MPSKGRTTSIDNGLSPVPHGDDEALGSVDVGSAKQRSIKIHMSLHSFRMIMITQFTHPLGQGLQRERMCFRGRVRDQLNQGYWIDGELYALPAPSDGGQRRKRVHEVFHCQKFQACIWKYLNRCRD